MTLFDQLDFLYMPTQDVAGEVEHFTTELGAELVFAIEAFGARVAQVKLTDAPPAVMFADHLEGDRPVLVYRVADLDAAIAELGAGDRPRFDIPHGPCVELHTPGGHRVALYELTRPEVPQRFRGRRDF